MTTVALLAGGLGHRLRSITGPELPKALVPVLGRPFIDWQLEGLAAAGATSAVLLVAHHADQIRDHVGDGNRFDIDVRYVEDGASPLGTGGALLAALPELPRVFWVTYGDTLLDVDLTAAAKAFAVADAPAIMTVLRNCDEWQPSNVRVVGCRVDEYSKDPTPVGAEHIDYGMLAFDKVAWQGFDDGSAFDLSDVVQRLLPSPGVAAFEVSERFHDVGTPEAVRETEAYLRQRVTRP